LLLRSFLLFFVFPVGLIQIQIVEIMLPLMLAVRDFHVVAVHLCEVIVVTFYPHERLALEDIRRIHALHVLAHHTFQPVGMVGYQLALIVIMRACFIISYLEKCSRRAMMFLGTASNGNTST
jgi:hypothetical protein